MDRHRQRWDLAGVDTCVYDTCRPRGRTVVMVHGGDPRSLANAHDWSTIWDPDALAARLVAYDKPGQGLTYDATTPDAAMSATGLTDHLEALLDRVGDAKVVLMGHSRGALPAADLALRSPDRVAGLVLVASNTLAPPSPRTPRDFYLRAYTDPPAKPTVEYVRREPEMNSYDTGHIDARFIDGRMHPATSTGWWADRDRRARLHAEVVGPSLERRRGRILAAVTAQGFAMPVLQVWGQEDVSAPVELAHRLYGSICTYTPESWSLVLNGSGHYVYRERPRQFGAALRAFLDTLPR